MNREEVCNGVGGGTERIQSVRQTGQTGWRTDGQNDKQTDRRHALLCHLSGGGGERKGFHVIVLEREREGWRRRQRERERENCILYVTF